MFLHCINRVGLRLKIDIPKQQIFFYLPRCVNGWSMKSLPSLLWFQGGYDLATSLGTHTRGPNSEPLNNLICYVKNSNYLAKPMLI